MTSLKDALKVAQNYPDEFMQAWLNSRTDSVCGIGKYPMLHTASGEMRFFENKFEFMNASFVENTGETSLTKDVWAGIDLFTDFNGEGFTHAGGEFTFTGECIRPRAVNFSAQVEALNDNQTIQIAYFVDQGSGFTIVPGFSLTHEFRFADILDSVVITSVMQLQQNIVGKIMVRNLSASNNIIFESARISVL